MKVLKNNLKNNIKNVSIVLALPVVLYFFLGPIFVYNANIKDFEFSIGDFFYTIAGVGIVLWVAGSLLISLLPEKVANIPIFVIFYIGIMSVIQDMFLNVKLSEGDGSNMNWDNMKKTTTINTIIWISVLIILVVIFIIFKERAKKIFVGVAGFIAAVQFLTFVFTFFTALSGERANREAESYGLTGDTQYELASDNNIIVFLVDTWGSYQFEKALAENPSLADGFNDFTYYDNADSSYFRTFPSMTHMLTGVDMNMDDSFTGYLKDAWNNQNAIDYYNDVHNAGYNFYVYSIGGKSVFGNAKNMVGLIDNAKKVTLGNDKKAAINRMAKISFYKYVPYIVKPRFEVYSYLFSSITYFTDSVACTCGNASYYDGIKYTGLSINNDVKNAVIVQHIDGTHKPYETSSECNTDYYNATLQTTQEGIVCELNYYIDRLKEMGLYDDTTIIITADHSSWTTDTEADDPQIVYFVKKAGESHATMEYNHAPISHDDFRATVLDIIGVNYEKYGRSIFDIDENEERERVIINQEFNSDYKKVEGNPSNVFTKYTYIGNRETITNKARNDGPDETHKINSK